MHSKYIYDIIIIGAGPAGFAAAMRAVDFGKKALLIEKSRPGGAGIFNGALSSKTFWELSKDFKVASKTDRGYACDNLVPNYKKVSETVGKAVELKHEQMRSQIAFLVQNGELDYVNGTASFEDGHHIQVLKRDGSAESYFGENIIVATGSSPREVPNIPVDHKNIITSDDISKLDEFPKSMVIIGAGVIGCEFATIFSNFQQTEVHIVDRADRILPFEDADVSEIVERNLTKAGAIIHNNAQLTAIKALNHGVEFELTYNDGLKRTFEVEKALVSIGRVNNLKNIGIEKAGLSLNQRGCIDVNNTVTTNDHIYAVGDNNGIKALANIGELEGRHAVETICGMNPKPIKHAESATIMFLNPEIASVGYNEQQLVERGIPYRMSKLPYAFINRAIAMRNTNGFLKILVSDDDEMKILGMRIAGAQASSAIESISLMIHFNRSIKDVINVVHPHPAIIEGIQECARLLLKTSILDPRLFQNEVVRYRVDTNGRKHPLFEDSKEGIMS